MAVRRTLTHAEWMAEGEARFGKDMMRWAFVCPACGHRQTVQDYKDAGAPETVVAFSCIGRYTRPGAHMGTKPGPCNYAGGGLLALNPVDVLIEGRVRPCFEFADA